MNDSPADVSWLDKTEMRAWRSYVVATLRLRSQLHRELAESHGLSLADYEVLVCLSSRPDHQVRMTELANMLGSTKSRLSHQVTRMEANGLIQRVSDVGDKRCVVAKLTEKGRLSLEQAAPTHVDGVRSHLIDLLTADEQIAFDVIFSRVREHLEKIEH